MVYLRIGLKIIQVTKQVMSAKAHTTNIYNHCDFVKYNLT